MNNGWIKLHREILEHWVYDDPEKLKVWITLISKASHTVHKQNVGYRIVELHPGELIFGTIKFANLINVSRDKLYRTIKLFEDDGMIDYDTETYKGEFSIVKINNWKQYQKPAEATEQAREGDSQTPNIRQTNTSQTPPQTNNNGNNVKNNISPAEKEILSVLNTIKLYPFDYERDIEYIRDLLTEYPKVDLLAEAKKWKIYKIDKPLKKNSNARSQFKNWIKNSIKWGRVEYVNEDGLKSTVSDKEIEEVLGLGVN